MGKLTKFKAVARIAKQTVVQHSPEILMGLGAVSFVATVVAIAKETVKEQEILEDHHNCLEIAEGFHGRLVCGLEIDDEAYKATRLDVYKGTALDTAKNYAPGVILGVTSMACFFGAFGIMRKRYATLVVAYTALEESFRTYRQRVIEDKGAEADLYYLTGAKVKEITTKDEEGKKVKQKQLVLPDGTIASPYAFKFSKYREDGDLNLQWSDDQTINLSYALGQQDYLNNELYNRCVFDDKHRVLYRGSVMLNEIRDLMGEGPTEAGAVVGNRFGNGEPGCNGFIDFGIVEGEDEYGPCLFINPNVDGLIFDLLGKKEPKPFEPSYNEWGESVRI